ncbi:MAG: hypothetical protein RR193_06555, partial [Christensenellaceae bacterium]
FNQDLSNEISTATSQVESLTQSESLKDAVFHENYHQIAQRMNIRARMLEKSRLLTRKNREDIAYTQINTKHYTEEMK